VPTPPCSGGSVEEAILDAHGSTPANAGSSGRGGRTQVHGDSFVRCRSRVKLLTCAPAQNAEAGTVRKDLTAR
jgi:hypothetical protein